MSARRASSSRSSRLCDALPAHDPPYCNTHPPDPPRVQNYYLQMYEPVESSSLCLTYPHMRSGYRFYITLWSRSMINILRLPSPRGASHACINVLGRKSRFHMYFAFYRQSILHENACVHSPRDAACSRCAGLIIFSASAPKKKLINVRLLSPHERSLDRR